MISQMGSRVSDSCLGIKRVAKALPVQKIQRDVLPASGREARCGIGVRRKKEFGKRDFVELVFKRARKLEDAKMCLGINRSRALMGLLRCGCSRGRQQEALPSSLACGRSLAGAASTSQSGQRLVLTCQRSRGEIRIARGAVATPGEGKGDRASQEAFEGHVFFSSCNFQKSLGKLVF